MLGGRTFLGGHARGGAEELLHRGDFTHLLVGLLLLKLGEGSQGGVGLGRGGLGQGQGPGLAGGPLAAGVGHLLFTLQPDQREDSVAGLSVGMSEHLLTRQTPPL